MAVLVSKLTEVNVKENVLEVTERAKKAQEQNREYQLDQEKTARNESKSSFKLGYKSKK